MENPRNISTAKKRLFRIITLANGSDKKKYIYNGRGIVLAHISLKVVDLHKISLLGGNNSSSRYSKNVNFKFLVLSSRTTSIEKSCRILKGIITNFSKAKKNFVNQFTLQRQ